MEEDIKMQANPVLEAGPFSRLTFWWLNRLFKRGYKHDLEVEDLYDTLPVDRSKDLCDKLQREWDREVENIKEGHKPSLRRALIRAFVRPFMIFGIFALLEEGIKVAQALLLGSLISYFNPDSTMETWKAYMYALGISLAAWALCVAHHLYFFGIQRVGMWLRVACCSLVYKKSLRLSNVALGKTTTGQIVNLMSNDVNRFDQAVIFVHFLWIGPIVCVVTFVILWQMVGAASLAGFALLLLLVPGQFYMGKLFSVLRMKTAILTDERVRLMNEILTGMRVIKMYCWEKMFGNLIYDVRSKESRRIRSASYVRACVTSPFFASAKLIAFLTFLTFILNGNVLTSEVVFVVIGIYQPVRLVMNLFVPMGFQYMAEAGVTVSRLETFMLLDELNPHASTSSSDVKSQADCKITALNATAIWDKSLTSNTLQDVSFEVRPGELLAVIGPVGAGKSSLLMALLGELPLVKGSVKVAGTVAYASQQPWVFSASVRQNIIFSRKFEMGRYQRVVKVCALAKDLELLPDGDGTLVGERGVSLSGGQKARISLARTLYMDADVYLLDDPLSAVDAAVGRHLFEKCICGALKSKPRILVTHQLQYLTAADRILVLKEGEVLGMGSYSELAESGIDFTSLLKHDDNPDVADVTSQIESLLGSPAENDCLSLPKKLILSASEIHPTVTSQSLDRGYLSELDAGVESHGLLLSKSLTTLEPGSVRKRTRTISVNTQKSTTSEGRGMFHASMLSLGSIADLDVKPDFIPQVQQSEARAGGTVTYKMYWEYFHTGAGVVGLVVLVLANLLAQTSFIAADWWLSYWCHQEEQRLVLIEEQQHLISLGYNATNITIPEVDRTFNMYIYTGITISVFVFGLLRSLFIFKVLVKSARLLHDKMFASIVRCPILFFDTNPVGRILNRFSKDMGHLDELLPLTMFDFIQCGLLVLGIVLVTGIVNPWVFIPLLPIVILFLFLRKYYLATSRDIKRLESTTRSPVFSHMTTTVNGLFTIRAYAVEDAFIRQFDAHQDVHSSAWYLILASSRWFAIRLDLLCAMFVTSVAFCCIPAASALTGGLVGLLLTCAISMMGLFQWAVRQSAEVENQMTSVERVLEYSQLPSEAPLESEPQSRPPADWPAKGIVSAEQANFSYTQDGPLVLKKLNFCIKPQEKIGIVGRTGAGKSSLIAMLFRLAEPTGYIRVDGIQTTDIGLHDLRNKISIIPQDPVLFTGTVRRNLDPFKQYSDEQLWKALEEVEMKSAIDDLSGGLSSPVSEGGANFSVGQRQLLCLARAILKKNKILVIDEATANVDPRTDSLIQETIRLKFQFCTVLTIAHRLHTIMDSDRIMVLDEGRIKEFDHPHILLLDENTMFSKMVAQTGEAEKNKLVAMAKDAHSRREAEADLINVDLDDEEEEEDEEKKKMEREDIKDDSHLIEKKNGNIHV